MRSAFACSSPSWHADPIVTDATTRARSDLPPLPAPTTAVPAEYEAARSGCVVLRRADRAFVRVAGRDPVRMVDGLITNDLAGAEPGRGVQAALLTPKGRMLARVRAVRRGEDVLLETDAAALQNVLDTLKKYVPPLFARAQDVSGEYGVVGVYGPGAAAVLRGDGGTAGIGMGGGDAGWGGITAGGMAGDVLVLDADGVEQGVDLVAPIDSCAALYEAILRAGAVPIGADTLEVVRIEDGRPRWGTELDETVIPLEAGLKDALISTSKGCYTGQEVIIRILHRGHVNRHLRGVIAGEVPLPSEGAQLFRADDGKAMGHLTSACASPRMGGTIALGYVRREIDPGTTVRLGAPDGPSVEIATLPFQGGSHV